MSTMQTHPYVPDLLIENDAPVCEICGDLMSNHTDEALIVQDWHRVMAERDRYREALEEIADSFDCDEWHPSTARTALDLDARTDSQIADDAIAAAERDANRGALPERRPGPR